MEQQQISLHCLIHKQPAYFLLFQNSNTSTQPPNQSVIKCSICIVKEKIKGEDLIALPEIMDPSIKQFSSDVSHLGDELDGKIKQMRMHYDSIEGINHIKDNISKFFDNFRKELELKLNESEKQALIAADKIQENLNFIFMKHEEIVSKNDLQGIIEKYSSNNDSNSDNTDHIQLNQELKAFFENQQKNKQANISILQNLFNKFEREKSTFDCYQPNLQKDRVLEDIKQMNFFVVSNSNNQRAEEERQKCDFLRYIVGNTEMIADIFVETVRIMANHPINLKEFQRPAFKSIVMANQVKGMLRGRMEDRGKYQKILFV